MLGRPTNLNEKMSYNKINNITGWVVFGIALIVYMMTMAPTASFWDCGEFIACANELQVPHPPGAPFYLILGRLFAMLAMGNEASVAYWVNMLSAMAGAFTVLFTFWTVTHLAKKLVTDGKELLLEKGQLIAVMGAGVVGGLTVCFADSIWFNSVEAEVYALSSFFTAVVVWLMFKWEARADDPGHLRWIILIAFVMGISIGAHLLNLLTIPALAFIYYFRKYEFSWTGVLMTFVAGVGILGFVQYIVIQQSVDAAWNFEQFFVGIEELNASGKLELSGLGLPFGSGVIIFILMTAFGLIGGIYLSQDRKIDQILQAPLWKKALFVLVTLDLLILLYAVISSVSGTGALVVIAGIAALIIVPLSTRGLEGIGPLLKRFQVGFNTMILSITVIVIGYSSYTMIPIRANAGTPINENDPSDMASLLSYLKREQYGDSPLFRGVRYNNLNQYEAKYVRKKFISLSDPRPLGDGTYKLSDGKSLTVKGGKVDGGAVPAGEDEFYSASLDDGRQVQIRRSDNKAYRLENRYLWDGYKQDIEYKSRYKVFFPRMWSGSHYKGVGQHSYINYVKRKGATDQPYDDKPTQAEDIKFFWDYQVRHMYLRYFMWNFAGRESDTQNDGIESGLEFGKISAMPDDIKNHPGKNHYFYLPLLLGIFGMVFQFTRNRKDAFSILLLFFFTGFAILLYLNQTPNQPRERDYSYAGSFQTFAMWVGLGVMGLYFLLDQVLKGTQAAVVAGSLCLAGAPLIMVWNNWDDHDRSARYVSPDSAHNLLMSCKKDAILFTNGDNDTFPLWYVQEVEGIRTDVRVVNLSLLNTDWYIDQMKMQQNESPPLPIRISQRDYVGDRNAFRSYPKKDTVFLKANPDALVKNGVIDASEKSIVVNPMPWALVARGPGRSSYLLKQDWMILEIMVNNANAGWPRPIYFSSTIPPASYLNMMDWFSVEGLAYRVIPVKRPKRTGDPFNQGWVDKERCYSLVMDTFRYRGLDNPDLYLDDHIRRTIIGNLRSTMFRTANAFVEDALQLENQVKRHELDLQALDGQEGEEAKRDSLQGLINAKKPLIAEDRRKAKEVLLKTEEAIHDNIVDKDPIFKMFAANAFAQLGENAKAKEYFRKIMTKVDETLTYYAEIEQTYSQEQRYLNTLPFVLGKLQEMQAWGEAADCAQMLARHSGDPSYNRVAEQLRARAGAEN